MCAGAQERMGVRGGGGMEREDPRREEDTTKRQI